MKKIAIIFMVLIASICNGQGVVDFFADKDSLEICNKDGHLWSCLSIGTPQYMGDAPPKYNITYPDSIVLVTPIEISWSTTCRRCGATGYRYEKDKRETVWKRPETKKIKRQTFMISETIELFKDEHGFKIGFEIVDSDTTVVNRILGTKVYEIIKDKTFMIIRYETI